jgi:transcriptional regulator with XRE-family HTH domain
MSPFAAFLHDLRVRRDIRQSDLAELIGYERSYIAALEASIKGPPTAEFIEKLVSALALSESEERQLSQALLASERKLVLDPQSSQETYWLLADLRQQIASLHPAQIKVMRDIIAMPDSLATRVTEADWRVKRRIKEETPM